MSRSANGFSLLEVLVALLIIGVIGLGALGLSMQVARGTESTRAHTIGQALALWSLEEAIIEDAGASPAATYTPPFDQLQFTILVQSADRTTEYSSVVTWKGGQAVIRRTVFNTAGAGP